MSVKNPLLHNVNRTDSPSPSGHDSPISTGSPLHRGNGDDDYDVELHLLSGHRRSIGRGFGVEGEGEGSGDEDEDEDEEDGDGEEDSSENEEGGSTPARQRQAGKFQPPQKLELVMIVVAGGLVAGLSVMAGLTTIYDWVL